MESFTHNSVTYTLRERTFHREKDGGFEKWIFEIDNKKYYMDGDIRFLSGCNGKVMVVDFYSEESLDNGIWETTNTEGHQAQHILNCLIELIVKRLPGSRHYRYLAFPCSPKWKTIVPILIERYGTFVNENINKEVEDILNYNLTVLIDSGYYSCYVGEITATQ